MNLTRHPLFIVAVAIVAVIGLYYLMSPYQNCLRGFHIDTKLVRQAFCTTNTSW